MGKTGVICCSRSPRANAVLFDECWSIDSEPFVGASFYPLPSPDCVGGIPSPHRGEGNGFGENEKGWLINVPHSIPIRESGT